MPLGDPPDFSFHRLSDGPMPPQALDPSLELRLLRVLEKRMRKMFAFTGWEDDVDDEARVTVQKVEQALDDLVAARRILIAAFSESKD